MKKEMVYKDTFLIDPVPASRPRVTRWKTYYSKTYTKFKDTMVAILLSKPPICPVEGCLHVNTTFYKKIPKSYSKKKHLELDSNFCEGNMDNDNLEKAIWDALNGTVWVDDRQIVSNYTEKRWSSNNPRIEIEVYKYV